MTVNQMNMYLVGKCWPGRSPRVMKTNNKARRYVSASQTKNSAGRGIGPSRRIRLLAASRPDGAIRWHEAASIYLSLSEPAQEDERIGATHYHLNLQQIFRRYFVRVKRGHYVLSREVAGG